MSLTISNFLRHFRLVNKGIADTSFLTRCIHCSACCRDSGVGSQSSDVASVKKQPNTRVIRKEETISLAMKVYLERKIKAETSMKHQMEEYKLGKQHLANIMGVDESELTPEVIKKAIQYLLPSGLFAKRARPIMEDPAVLIPQFQAAGFSRTGRPNHYLFYTYKPRYYELMHDLAKILNEVREKALEQDPPDLQARQRKMYEKIQYSNWMSILRFKEKFKGERISDAEYRRFTILMDSIMEEKHGYLYEEIYMKYREPVIGIGNRKKPEEPKVDENGREYITAEGGRKKCTAQVTLRANGSGQITINNRDIAYFTCLTNRQQVLWPLQLFGLMDKFDIEATVEGPGETAQAGAIRLGVARALRSFITEDQSESLRIAGLLTRDPRMKERKKPGQEKARKKFTWKRR